MFMKLASGPMSALFGVSGFVSMFALNLAGRRGWLASLTGAFFGALGFLAVWFLIIMILNILFSEEELSRIFLKSRPQKPAAPAPDPNEYKLDDDEDDLTAEDLYAPSAPGPSMFAAEEAHTPSPVGRHNDSSSKAASGLDSAGAFDLHAGSRVMRANVKEAALAARKVLMNDHKK